MRHFDSFVGGRTPDADDDLRPLGSEGIEVMETQSKITYLFPTVDSWRQVAQRNVRILFTDEELATIDGVALYNTDPFHGGSAPFAPDILDLELHGYFEEWVSVEMKLLHDEHVIAIHLKHGASS